MFTRLVHDVFVDDSPTSSKSDPETDCDRLQESAIVSVDDERNPTRVSDTLCSPWKGERRRRKLPEIPKNKKRKYSGATFDSCY